MVTSSFLGYVGEIESEFEPAYTLLCQGQCFQLSRVCGGRRDTTSRPTSYSYYGIFLAVVYGFFSDLRSPPKESYIVGQDRCLLSQFLERAKISSPVSEGLSPLQELRVTLILCAMTRLRSPSAVQQPSLTPKHHTYVELHLRPTARPRWLLPQMESTAATAAAAAVAAATAAATAAAIAIRHRRDNPLLLGCRNHPRSRRTLASLPWTQTRPFNNNRYPFFGWPSSYIRMRRCSCC